MNTPRTLSLAQFTSTIFLVLLLDQDQSCTTQWDAQGYTGSSSHLTCTLASAFGPSSPDKTVVGKDKVAKLGGNLESCPLRNARAFS